VRDILDGRHLTREELGVEIGGRKGLAHLGDGLRSGWGTLLKPLAFQGELCFGPSRGNRVTFTTPQTATRHWPGMPAIDAAAQRVMTAYLGAYGPATIDRIGAWLAGGWFGTRQLRGWLEALGPDLATVEVEGAPAYALASDVDAIASARRSKAVRLLPGFDQWVLGPGTADGVVTPKARRAQVSRQAGWISPVVVVGGVVNGTWELSADRVTVTWFSENGRLPRTRLAEEVERLSTILGRDLVLAVARG
jgi:Winged helix DNA-binding domain